MSGKRGKREADEAQKKRGNNKARDMTMIARWANRRRRNKGISERVGVVGVDPVPRERRGTHEAWPVTRDGSRVTCERLRLVTVYAQGRGGC